MMAVFAKAAFAHRLLWKRDETYRIAFVLGPPVMLGALVATGAWTGVHHAVQPPWAHPQVSINPAQAGKPIAVAPLAPLPLTGPDGKIPGLAPGWTGSVHKVTIAAVEGPNVQPEKIGHFFLAPGAVDLAQIIAAGPPADVFVGVEEGFLLVRAAGRYELGLRLQRSSYQMTNCSVRFGFGGHRVVRQYQINIVGQTNISWPPATFDLKPGVYRLGMSFGCWRDDQMVGPGDLTVMIRHPGETAPAPARADELWRPASGAN